MIPIITDLPIIYHEMFYFTGEQVLSHCHARFLCLLNGELSIESMGQNWILAGGDILFLPEETEYKVTSGQSSLILYACLHPYFLLQGLGYPRHRIKTIYTDAQPELRAGLSARIAGLITHCLGQGDSSSCGVYAKAYGLLDYLSNFCMEDAADGFGGTADKAGAKLLLLEQYLGSRYMQTISLKDAAEACGYTPQYLASFLKKHLGVTFQEYLNAFRLEASRLLLAYSQEPLAKVALLSGFPNQGSFLHSFEKSQGMAAEDYRLLCREQHQSLGGLSGIQVTNVPLIQDLILNYMDYVAPPDTLRKDAFLEEARIPAAPSGALEPLWNRLVNLGSARDYEKPAFRRHLSRIQEALHFEYGRCTEVFGLVKEYTAGGKKTYDFSLVFGLIDFMRSIHMKPFLDIDAKPFQLYKGVRDPDTDYRTYLSADDYDGFLEEVFPEFIKACITRYGFDELSGWRFELWRRYNAGMSSLEPAEVFFNRFQRTADLLKSLAPDAKLGGFGFNSFLPAQNFRELLLPFVRARYRPDFISAYHFPYTALAVERVGAPSGYLSSGRVSDMAMRLVEYRAIQKELGFGQTPLYITEYSAHLTRENYINDSTYPATYIFCQSIQGQGLTEALGYWLATDLSLKFGNPNSPLFGGNGLLTKNGVPKSTFHAHAFLNRLGPMLLARGEHYIATRTQDQSFQILTFCQGSLKQSFADAPTRQELLQYPHSAFEDTKPLELSLTLTGLLPGNYRIKEYSLDFSHGNVMRTWGQLGHAPSLTPEEVRYMEAQSAPSLQIHKELLGDAYLLHTTLNPNEARLYLLDLLPERP